MYASLCLLITSCFLTAVAASSHHHDSECEHDEECPSSGGKCAMFPKCQHGKCVQQFRPKHYRCRKATKGACEGLDTYCTGSSNDCPAADFAPASTVCAKETDCMKAIHCSGTSHKCPEPTPDLFKSADTLCRKATGSCEDDAKCDGAGKCPPNKFKPSTIVCRASKGICDHEETCTGDSEHCPHDQRKPKGTVCRAKNAVNKCDLEAEVCDGTSPTCPEMNDIATEGYTYKCHGHTTCYLCGAPQSEVHRSDHKVHHHHVSYFEKEECDMGTCHHFKVLPYPSCVNMCMKCTGFTGSLKPEDVSHQWSHKCDSSTGKWTCTGNKHEDSKACVHAM